MREDRVCDRLVVRPASCRLKNGGSFIDALKKMILGLYLLNRNNKGYFLIKGATINTTLGSYDAENHRGRSCREVSSDLSGSLCISER